MTKADMLMLINQRIPELEATYRSYFDDSRHTYKSRKQLRSVVLKDLGTLKLIRFLLYKCNDVEVTDRLMLSTFERLTEPQRKG